MRSIDDGLTWTREEAAEANLWLSAAGGNGKSVAVAGSANNRVMNSPSPAPPP